jgi:endonuclease-3
LSQETELMDETDRVRAVYDRIRAAAQRWPQTALSYFENDPFKALITGMLSAQTREEQTIAAAQRLFALADAPDAMLRLSDEQIIEAIRPVSYYQNKARFVRGICERLVNVDGGVVPSSLEGLMAYPGVGWKVAVLTRATGFNIHDDITVDVHVARIGKRLGLVQPATNQPPKINEELKAALPRDIWPFWNGLMVQFGREVCKPTYPQCAACPVADLCPRIGVRQTGPTSYRDAAG